MAYRGLLAVPGFNARKQTLCWFVRFPNQAIESIRGNTPEEVVDSVYERNLQDKAEKAPVVEPVEVKPQRSAGPRIRPGSIKDKENENGNI
jgi:hypothetical protein